MSLGDAELAGYVANALVGGVDSASDPQLVGTFTQIVSALNNDLQLGFVAVDEIPQWKWAMQCKTSLLQRISDIGNVCVTGAEQGFVFPDNPFPSIDQMNRPRKLFDPIPLTFDSVAAGAAIRELNAVVIAISSGELSLDRPASAGQIASFEVSVDGISSQSGDPLADILGYQPDGDAIKRKQAVDALGKLDFSKRKPYLLFVADKVSNGRRTGETILCWQKMRDAAGYKVTRRDTLAMVDRPPFVIDNSYVEATTEKLRSDPEFTKLISFYDWLPADGFYALMDQTDPNTIYRYNVGGFQKKIPANHSFFDVPTAALYLSEGQVQAVRSAISAEASLYQVSTGSISPYPSLASVVYGDPSYGWVIAGCNFLASARRGDPGTKTRSLAFIGSNVASVIDALSLQQIVLPSSLGDVTSAISSAISSYGISQTILSILDGIGVTDFISGKDPTSGFNPTTDSVSQSVNGLAKILSAVDPETATLDPNALLASLSTPPPPSGRSPSRYKTFSLGEGLLGPSTPKPDLLQTIGPDTIDLTTYVGISRLMVALRDFYDLYPGTI